jgi:hypothetical protein
LREAAETVFVYFFRRKRNDLLTEAGLQINEIQESGDPRLEVLQSAGITIGRISALTSVQLSRVLSAIDEQIAQLEVRRMKAIRTLISSRARSEKVGYSRARRVKTQRDVEYRTLENVRAYDAKFGRFKR